MADVENNIQFTNSTNFDLASNSKQFTAMCILLLAEEGKLKRTDDIRKYIPEMPEYEAMVTIDHLLHHTSGIRDYLSLFRIACRPDEDHTKKNMLRVIADQKSLNFEPGSDHLYSNSNYFLLGLIVERVSKIPFHQYVRKNILDPLGMDHTFFSEEVQLKNETASYILMDTLYKRSEIKSIYYYGDGGMLSNMEDLVKWDQNFYHNILGKKDQGLITDMQRTAQLNNTMETHCAAGLFCFEYKGVEVVMHGGSYGSFTTQWMRFPKYNLTILCLSNTPINTSSYCFAIADLLLKDYLKEEPIPEDKETVIPEALSGFYYSNTSSSYHYIGIDNNTLVMDWKKYITIDYYKYGTTDSWNWKNYLHFKTPNNGPVIMNQQVEYLFDRYTKFLPDSLNKNCLGKYICKELSNLSLEIKLESGNYTFIMKNKYSGTITETFGNLFLMPAFHSVAELEINNEGDVTGLYLSSERVKRLYFKK